MEEDLSRFCCQNPDCPDYGQRGHGNLTVCGHYGKAQQHPAALLPHLQGPLLRAEGHPAVPLRVAAGEGPRPWSSTSPTATGCGPPLGWSACTATPVVRYSRLLGEHARRLHDELVAFSPADPRGPAR